MARANEAFRTSAPIRAKLPTKAYPYLKKLIHECDFACSTCSSAHGQPIYRTVAEVLQAGSHQPINGPGNTVSRFGLLCPECFTAPSEGPFIQNGIIDLLTVPPTYKRPNRPSVTSDDNMFEDEDDVDAPVLRASQGKKESELHPKTRGTKVKGKAFSELKATLKKKAKASKGSDTQV